MHKIQIDDEIRDATADELAIIDKLISDKAEQEKAEANRQIKKQEILKKLGLTAEEAQALLG